MNIKFTSRNYFTIFKHPLMGISLQNWCRVLVRNRFRIHPAFWLRTLFITLNTLANALLQLFEYIRFSRKIKREKVEAPVFILGHPRSGTTHLHYLLSKDKQFGYCSLNEAVLPHIFLSGGKLFRKLIGLSLPETRPQDDVKVTVDSPKEEEFALANLSRTSYMFGFYFPKRIAQNYDESVGFSSEKDKKHWQKHFLFFLKKLQYKNKGKHLLLKSPANTGRVEEILELFPDAKFIHISRDPYEVFQSTVRLYEKIIPVTSFQHVDDNRVEDFIIDSYRKMYDSYFSAIDKLDSDRLVEVKFVDLDKNPLGVLEKVYDQLELENFDQAREGFNQELERTLGYKKNTYSELPSETRERLQNAWGSIFKKLGYSI